MAHLGETIPYDTVFYQVTSDLVAERYGSAAAESGSEGRADAVGSRLQPNVRLGHYTSPDASGSEGRADAVSRHLQAVVR
jgi:hypothetical protein